MTQEEIIEAISDDKMMPFIQPEQLAQIVEFVINNYRPFLPSDLYEAAEDRVTENGRFELTASEKMRIDDIMFGAEWMAGHLRDSTEMIPDGLYEAAENIYKTPFGTRAEDFIAGAEWMKAKMMKDAVEGVVCYGSKGAYIETDFLREYDTDVYGNSGDKVRVIVIKEDK